LIPLNIQIYDCSLSLLGAGTSIKSGGVKLVLYAQTSPLGMSMRKKCLPTSHMTFSGIALEYKYQFGAKVSY